MAMTLEELRKLAGTSRPTTTPKAQKMTLDELRKLAGTTAPVQQTRVQPVTSQPIQTAGDNSSAVSFADKMVENPVEQTVPEQKVEKPVPTITAKQKYGNTLYVPASAIATENEKRNKLNYVVNENLRHTAGWGMNNPYAQLDHISEFDRLAIADMVAKKDYDGAYKRLEVISKELDAKLADAEYKQVAQFAEEHPAAAGVVSIGNSLFKPAELGVNYADYFANKLQGKDTQFDTNANTFSTSRFSEAANEGIMKDDGIIGQLLKGSAMSMGNQLAVSGLVGKGPATEIFMAMQAAQDSLYENSKRGLTADEAVLNSMGKGAITYWAERFFPSEELLKIDADGVADTLWKSIAKGALPEGIEEIAENIASNTWDLFQLKDKSEISQLENELKERGYDADKATLKALTQKYIYDSLMGFAGGVFAGGVTSGGVHMVNNALYGKNTGVKQQTETRENAAEKPVGVQAYVDTLKETAKADSKKYLNSKYVDSGMTVAQYAQNNVDGNFFKGGNHYYMEKNGKTVPVPKTLHDYAKYLQENGVQPAVASQTETAPEAVKPAENIAPVQQTAQPVAQTIQLPNPINAGIMQTAGAGKPFDISKLPQYKQTIQLPNPANAGVNQQAESGKPFDISALPQPEKKTTPVVPRLKEYINTLSETQGKNAEINLNKKHNDSNVTVAQFVENNADANFYKEGKLYYMEKDGKKLPVKKSMYDYAIYLQGDIDTNVVKTEVNNKETDVDVTSYGKAKVIGKRDNVDILDSVPDGWKKFDMQTAPVGYVGITNGQSLFGGKHKIALVAEDAINKKPHTRTPKIAMPVYNADEHLEQGTLEGGFEIDNEEILLQNKEDYAKDTEFLRELIGLDKDADVSEINMMDDLHEVVNYSPDYEKLKKEFSVEDMKLLKETDADLYEELMDIGNYTPESYEAQIDYWNNLGKNFKSKEYHQYIDEAIENRKENQGVAKRAVERISKAKPVNQMTAGQETILNRWKKDEIKSVEFDSNGNMVLDLAFDGFGKTIVVDKNGKWQFAGEENETQKKQPVAVEAKPVVEEKTNMPSRLNEYLNGFSSMQKAKVEKTLNTKLKYSEGVMTRAEFVESKIEQDGNADNFVKTERKAEISNAVKKTIDDAFFGGNENSVKAKLGKYWVDTAETKAFMENPHSDARWKAKASILENARPVKTTYGYENSNGTRTEITKTEYDFAMWLNKNTDVSISLEKSSIAEYNVTKEGDNIGKKTSQRDDTRGTDRVRSRFSDDAGRTKIQRNGARVPEIRDRRKFRNITDKYSARQRYERLINSPEFYAKDASGKPIIVFHGTNADFDVFKPSATDIGIHFGDLAQAQAINERKDGHRVISAEIDIKNPVYVDVDVFGTETVNGYFKAFFETSDLPDSAIEYIKLHSGQYYALNEMLIQETSKNQPNVEVLNKILDELETLEAERSSMSVKEWCNRLNRGLENDLKALGYDGVVYHNNEEGEQIRLSYAVFDNSQIKQIDKNYTKGTSKDVSNSLPENKNTEKKTKPKKEKATENKITDFGEKIGGARKDDWQDRGLNVNDIAGMTDKEKAKFITKDNIWKKPNYEALIKEGKDKNVTYFLKTVRDGLPTKPEFRTTNKELAQKVQEEYVKQMREFTDLVMSLDTKEKVMNAFDEVLVKGGYITKDSSRLYAPWHPTEKGKHIFTEKLFNAFRNAEGVNGWRYLSNKVQKDQFGVSSSEKIPKGYSLTEFDDGWAVLKGYKVVSKEFATRESALAWLKENTKKTKNNRFVPPSVERVRREGVDVRQGTEVTGEMLQKRYGFRGGEFGNWTNQKERQMNLNFAFDAFYDLARTLGISEKDVALGGKLGIAFGARGKGGAKAAAAHYEPTFEVINLTRMKGAGTLGHEWAHALDDIIGVKAIGKAFTKSRGTYQAYDNLLDTMKWRDATTEELAKMNQDAKERNIKSATSWLNSVFSKYTMDKMTDSQKTEFEKLKSAFLSGEKGSVDKLNNLHKEATGRVIPSGTRNTLTTFERIWLVSDSNNRTSAKVPTNFMEGSKYFDKFENRSETYWASDVEIFARAFHTYLLDKTEGKSDYLNASAEWYVAPDLETGEIYRAYPYGEERIVINKAFDEFFGALKKDGWLTAQEYDAGEMISYSTDGAKVTMEGKIVIEPKKEKAPESPHKLVPEKFAKDNNVHSKQEKAKGASGKLPESVGAMKSGYYASIEEYGAYPEGEKATNPVDVPMSIDGEHGVTRGVRTIMEAAVTAEEMLADYQNAIAEGEFNYDIKRDKPVAEKAVKYIEKYGFEQTLKEWKKKIAEKETITKDDMAKAQIMYASAASIGDYTTAMELATDISIEATKAGQVVQSMRLLKKTTPEGRLYYAQRSLDAIKEDIEEKYGDKAPEIDVPESMLEAIKNAETAEALMEAKEKMAVHIAKQLPFSWSNFINSWRYLAMLGNVRTQWRNVLSNCISGIAQEWTNLVQTAGENALEIAGKNIERTSAVKTTEWQRKQAEADFKNIENELYGKGKYKNDSLYGIQKLQNPFDFKGKGGKAGDVAGKVLTGWNELTNKAMEKGDKIFSEPAYKRYYARYLAANKITSEAQLTNKVKMSARAWATKQANEAVFRESNAFAEWISELETQMLRSTKPGTKTTAKLVGGLMPFRSTPLNITKRAFEYTPVGIATELGWQAFSHKKYGKDYDITQLINKAAKSFSGTVLIAIGYALAKAGVLTGGLGDDKEDKMKKQMGEQEYAINTDNWSFTMDWAGAGVMPLFVGAQMYQMTEEESDGFFMAMLDTLANASAPVMETSMMTGLMSAINDFKYEDDATKSVMTFLSSGIASYLGQFVPTILGQVARAVDDTSRTAYTSTKGVVKPLAKTLEKAQNKIPFASMSNVPYMDVWGNDVKNVGGNPLGRLVYNMLSPGYIEKKSDDKVEKMLMELYEETGEKSVLPSNYTTYKELNGKTIRFTDKQFEQYSKEYGQTAYKNLEKLFADNRFKKLPAEEKVDAIERIYKYSTATASKSTVNKKMSDADNRKKDALNSGVSSYYVFTGADVADREGDNKGSTSEAEAIAYINNHASSLSDVQKAYLYKVIGEDKGYTDEENKIYVKTYADTMRNINNNVSKAYREAIYKPANNYARELAKVKAGVEETTKSLDNKESALNAGVSPYYIFTGKDTADEIGNANGYTSKAEVVKYIESLGLSRTEKAYLFAALGNSNWKNPYI